MGIERKWEKSMKKKKKKKAGIITFIGRVNEDVKDTDDAGNHKGKRMLRKEMIWMCNNFEDTFLLCPNLFSLFTLFFFFFKLKAHSGIRQRDQ